MLQVLDEEAQQRILGSFHGGRLVMLVLAQKQEVLPELVLGEGCRVALEMLRQLSYVTDVLLFGRLTKIFKLDVFLELGDRRIVDILHRPGRMPACADNFPANLQAMNGALLSSCRVAAQLNQRPGVDAGWPLLFPFLRLRSRATQAGC